jgi:DNA-directed RNA polymerase specialized sigma24 family protein
VAADLGIPLGTAKSRLHRAMSVLRSTVVGGVPDETSSALPEGRPA